MLPENEQEFLGGPFRAHVVLARNTGTPEHHGTFRNTRKNWNTPEKNRNNPKKPGTPHKKPGTPPKKPGTPFFYRLPAVYPLLQELILSISRIKIYFLFPLKR